MTASKEFAEVQDELNRAVAKYGSFLSAHEGFAIIEEEFLELRKEIFKKQTVRSIDKMRKEAKQLAAMATRFMVDICGGEDE